MPSSEQHALTRVIEAFEEALQRRTHTSQSQLYLALGSLGDALSDPEQLDELRASASRAATEAARDVWDARERADAELPEAAVRLAIQASRLALQHQDGAERLIGS